MAEAEPLIRNVADTAFLVAYFRAQESERPDALFVDPLASKLAGDRGREIGSQVAGASMMRWSVALRTRVIDTYLTEALERGVDTIINLGAGLDTRPYRMNLPESLHWVEIDAPEVIAFKETQLDGERARCRLERIPLDLRDEEARGALFGALDARAGRTQVLTEGVIPYLQSEEVASLAADLHRMRKLDSWIIDYFSPETLAFRKRTRIHGQFQQAQFKFEPADWLGFFTERGWRNLETKYLAVEGARYRRQPPLPWAARALRAVMLRFIPPERRTRFDNFLAYVRLEPVRA
ncbi:MAG TPA: SAM-dependent methyltransferase [Polyangiaceae bacterium]|nr:SAM-dependent methyltransferase [Polyangiaceae bacterium]